MPVLYCELVNVPPKVPTRDQDVKEINTKNLPMTTMVCNDFYKPAYELDDLVHM